MFKSKLVQGVLLIAPMIVAVVTGAVLSELGRVIGILVGMGFLVLFACAGVARIQEYLDERKEKN